MTRRVELRSAIGRSVVAVRVLALGGFCLCMLLSLVLWDGDWALAAPLVLLLAEATRGIEVSDDDS
jgi:hypothetical protein